MYSFFPDESGPTPFDRHRGLGHPGHGDHGARGEFDLPGVAQARGGPGFGGGFDGFGEFRPHRRPSRGRGVPQPPFPPEPPGPGGHGGRGRRGRGHRHGDRRQRGDVRSAILALLVERSMHGYEMIKEITERSGGFWRPSPGSVYPTLQLLADEGLIASAEGSGGRRLFELTDQGREQATKIAETPPWEQIAMDVDPAEVALREAMGQLGAAAMQVSSAGSSGQKSRAVDVLNEARRSLYAILSEVAEPEQDDEGDEPAGD